MLNIPVKDSTAGFRIYTSDILQKIDLGSISSEGYSFQIEMTKKILELDSNWLEIPIKFVERRNGKSKMSRRIVFEALYQVGKWKFKKGLKR
jgi:dolichol-phosphate mannosyltransferase